MEPRNRFQGTDSWAPSFRNSGSAWRLIEELVTQQNFIKLAFSSSFLALKLTHLFKGQILGQNSDKVLRVSSMLFSYLYSFALRFLFLKTHATSYSFNISVTTIPPYLWFMKSAETSSLRTIKNMPQRNSQKPQRNSKFMNSASSISGKVIFVLLKKMFFLV
jgi:hypothetical protein